MIEMTPAQSLRLIFDLQRIQKSLATANEDAEKAADDIESLGGYNNRYAAKSGVLRVRCEYAAEEIEAIIERLKAETKEAPAAVGNDTRAGMADRD